MININFYSNGFANHIVRKAKTKKTNTSLRDPFCNLFMKTSCWQYNKSPTDKAYTIKMTEYLPHLFSIFAFLHFSFKLPLILSQYYKMKKAEFYNLATMLPSWLFNLLQKCIWINLLQQKLLLPIFYHKK